MESRTIHYNDGGTALLEFGGGFYSYACQHPVPGGGCGLRTDSNSGSISRSLAGHAEDIHQGLSGGSSGLGWTDDAAISRY